MENTKKVIKNKMINVTKSYLPPIEEYTNRISEIWDSHWLTNNGKFAKELESKLNEYLQVPYFHFVSNGTIALQLAIHALDLCDCDIITSPFSYVATTSSILWEKCNPIFVDIDPKTFNIDCKKIEEKITPHTKAIMAVHVFGNPCDVIEIEKIAKKHNLKVIYDGAHSFGVKYLGESLLSYGDISTCSFHATKVFHTVEGGCCICKDKDIDKKLNLLKKFGYENDDYELAGINAKNSEFHAAMGLAVFDHLDEMIEKRKFNSEIYDSYLKGKVTFQKKVDNIIYNYIYYPIVLESENIVLKVINALKENDIMARRYFYPSLNELPYLKDKVSCPIAEDISKRIICLPLDTYLTKNDIEKICDIIFQTMERES